MPQRRKADGCLFPAVYHILHNLLLFCIQLISHFRQEVPESIPNLLRDFRPNHLGAALRIQGRRSEAEAVAGGIIHKQDCFPCFIIIKLQLLKALRRLSCLQLAGHRQGGHHPKAFRSVVIGRLCSVLHNQGNGFVRRPLLCPGLENHSRKQRCYQRQHP